MLLICDRCNNQRFLILDDRISRVKNIKEDSVLEVLFGWRIYVQRTLRAQITLASFTYLALIAPIAPE